jgi:hypothetical protein
MEIGSEVWIKDLKSDQAWIPGFVINKVENSDPLIKDKITLFSECGRKYHNLFPK